ncbi:MULTISPECIES: tryptophan halogenase family protein [unclassified Colwellia]|uniref:tryptophan halogenase family protein n=1 Tax=unclassified Colwellia TaxID=196834 RepID=UPI0015F3DC19|nr:MULTISPECIES: tryptophan halogenase family protein [unclassified Colwellia]MBA6257647.1 tryptophan 7-halogenase [Colwellia sp. MB3u-28]MBA6259404.1 tryptophan 7-halogenase [Colwellia sp. MB3u-41]
MSNPIKTVVIVGGGIAGWLTAGRLAAKHKGQSVNGLNVVLVESPHIPIVGVGEGTWPTMRSTLLALGISETDFIRECDASFKQGAKFAKWVDGKDDDFYYHPLVIPQGFGKGDIAGHWLAKQHNADTSSFSNDVCYQEALCEQGLAPKTIRTPEYADVANYAYHLDSGKFALFLQKHCTNTLGVKHVLDDVTSINTLENGDIASVLTSEHGEVAGDLFVDCTGFSSLLLGKHYQVPFKSCSDVLFIDTALAVHVPYENENDEIASHTLSTGQEAGWIWDIGLQHRRGVGYVYSSKHSSEEQAKAVLARYVGDTFDSLTVRKIPIVSGYREKFWQNNCVAVGLSAGFLEPLEASALVLVELSAQMISEQLPQSRDIMDIVAKRFNETFLYRWEKIIDFLKLHYILSKRTDNTFWTDNRDPKSIPESLKEAMALWQYRAPADHDFTSRNEVFPAASYQYILYGMGFKSDYSQHVYALDDISFAQYHFAQNKKLIDKAVSLLPKNRELINKVIEFGFNRI